MTGIAGVCYVTLSALAKPPDLNFSTRPLSCASKGAKRSENSAIEETFCRGASCPFCASSAICSLASIMAAASSLSCADGGHGCGSGDAVGCGVGSCRPGVESTWVMVGYSSMIRIQPKSLLLKGSTFMSFFFSFSNRTQALRSSKSTPSRVAQIATATLDGSGSVCHSSFKCFNVHGH